MVQGAALAGLPAVDIGIRSSPREIARAEMVPGASSEPSREEPSDDGVYRKETGDRGGRLNYTVKVNAQRRLSLHSVGADKCPLSLRLCLFLARASSSTKSLWKPKRNKDMEGTHFRLHCTTAFSGKPSLAGAP
jgi:hypothetical protein